MILFFKKNSFLVLLFFIISTIKAQEEQLDSLYNQDFNPIVTDYKESFSDSIKIRNAKTSLSKAKKKQDFIKIADSYYLLSNLYEHTPLAIKYTDSILSLNIKRKNSSYPAKGYLQKGIQLYYLAKHSEALENYLKANKYYAISNDEYGQLCVKHYIGLLKNKINKSDESLIIFRKNLLFFDTKKKQEKHLKQYLKSLFALADSYNRNKKLDSAEIINKRGILESLKDDEKYLYPYFLLSYGITKNFKKQYDLAIDSLLKSNKLLRNEKTVLAGSNLYLYKSFLGKNNISKAIEYLEKNDSLYKINPEIIFQAKESYEFLLKHYKNNNSNSYLKTIESLLNIDSIIKIKHSDLNKEIVYKYEIPLLLTEKERLISELNRNNSFNKTSILVLIILTSLFLFSAFYFFKKNRINKKRFLTLIHEHENKKKTSNNKKLIEITTTNTTGLSEKLVKDILHKLLLFEKSNKFIKKNYTLNVLAKELKTNSSYLSKIINSSKQVNFPNYINKLRIDYAIDKLKVDTLFRNYTVQAIAEEVGFNKAQSFSTAFQKQTGISIVYFINQINESKKTDY